MLAEIAPFQALLDAIGWLLAWLYDLTGNFGFAIIILTIIFRIVLLPLGIKQIKSMQAMQALQPKIKEIQKKFKGNKQKIQEQTMKLYQEYGVNPLGGCLPLLLQFPILIAMYAVIRAPVPSPPNPQTGEVVYANNHLPEDSDLFTDITAHEGEGQQFLFMNLQCAPKDAGKTVPVLNTEREPTGDTLDCGDSTADRIPYYAMLLLMIGSTFYSTRQTQKATPASAQNQQTQIITKVMPLMFGVFGFAFPAGLILYWTVSNGFQIGQQYVMLRLGHIGPQAMDRRLEAAKAKSSDTADKPRSGLMGRMMERADQERKRRLGEPRTAPETSSENHGEGLGGHRQAGHRWEWNEWFGQERHREGWLRQGIEGWLGAPEGIRPQPPEGVWEVEMEREPEGARSAEDDGREAAETDAPDLEEQADAMADFVEELLERMGVDAIAEPTTHRGHVYVDIVDGPEDDMALLIGRHGQTLDAIQELARTAVGRRLDDRIRVLIDVGDYRKRAEDRLVDHAREVAERVERTGEEEQLDPMNAYERKLVHDVVAEFDGLESVSEGADPDRFVVIKPL